MKIENLNQKRIFLIFEFIPVKLPNNTGPPKDKIYYFTNFNQDVTINNNTYSHDPTLQVSDITYDGGFNEPPVTISLGKSAFTDVLTINEARPRYRAIIREVTSDPLTSDRKVVTLFTGFVIEGRDSVSARNVVDIECRNAKVLFSEVSLGIPIQETCIWAFGNENQSPCGVPLEDKRLLGTLNFIKGTEVIISGLSLPPPGGFDSPNPNIISTQLGASFDYNDIYFIQGYVEYKDTRVTISKWSKSTPTKFLLLKQPPNSWIGKTVTVVPGCTKTLLRCGQWRNQGAFGGYLQKEGT